MFSNFMVIWFINLLWDTNTIFQILYRANSDKESVNDKNWEN